MDSLVARQFQMKAIWDNYSEDYYNRVHAFEKKIGRILTPYEIHIKCEIKDHGDIPEGSYERLRKVIWAIYNQKKDDMIKIMKNNPNEDFDEMMLIHWVDDRVKEQKLDFTEGKKQGVFSQIRSAYAAAQEPAPY